MLIDAPQAAPPAAPAGAAPAEPIGYRGLRLLPGVLVLVATVLVLRRHGVDLDTQGRFLGQLLGVVLLPGVLVWRGLRGRCGPLPFDLAGGAAIGYTMEIGWYLIGRATGFPYLHVVAAGAVVAAFLAVPRLWRHWRSGPPVDPRWAWAVAVLCLAMVAWAAVTYFTPHELTWPGAGTPYQDMMFHQALVGELRHHLPGQIPTVAGVPLSYHWFVHAEWAAVSWTTGIEPFLLTYRLGLMPAVVLIVVAIAAVAQRIVPGRWWSGPLAALLALFAVPADPAGWSSLAVPGAYLPGTMWISPTQTFGGLLCAAAVLAAVDLLRPDHPDGPPGARRWVLFVLLVVGATGGKATYGPLLLAGLGAVVGVGLLRRRLEIRAAVAAVLTLAVFALAMVTMFPGTSGGLFLAPLGSLQGAFPPTEHPGWTIGHALAIWALAWAAVFAAGIVLLCRRGWTDPMLTLCAGFAAAGLGVVLLAQQMSGSEIYFLTSARPYAAVLVVAALVAVAPTGAAARRTGWLVIPAVGCGVAATMIAQSVSGDTAPLGGTTAILWPYATPLLVAVVVGLLLMVPRPTRPVAVAAAGAVLLGAVVPTAIWYGQHVGRLNIAAATPVGQFPVAPYGAVQAGRWLRAHTDPDDVLASNNHCRYPGQLCDPRQFWLAAFAERRVLVEGWGYTPKANEVAARDRLGLLRIPFWDPLLLAYNDAAFLYPGAATIGALHSKYGVEWLVVDTRRAHDRDGLDQTARLRHEYGDVAIYQAGP